MKKTIKDFELKGKKVIIRCDLNVPMTNNKIDDETRIKSSLRTIKYALDNEAKVILLSHLGKVKTEEDKKKNSLYPVAEKLQEYLKCKVYFSKETTGPLLESMIDNLKEKEVLLVENTRFEDVPNKLESNCDDNLSKYWASLGDIFINDAYATCHRNHASVTGIPKHLPSGIGFLVESEIKKIDNILKSNTHPFIVVLGGKKVEDKIVLIEKILEKCDTLLVGGAMSFTFLSSQGFNLKDNIISTENISFCRKMLRKYPNKIILPTDLKVKNNGVITTKKIKDLSLGDIAFDIGPDSIKIFTNKLITAKRVIVNGPMGMFEDKDFKDGTDKIFKVLEKNKIKTIVGGGDTAHAANSLGYNTFYHISTGGGATIKYIEEEKLIGIEAIEDKTN